MPRHSIAPFPADIDRNIFGAWISGFVAGEGFFRLTVQREKNGRLNCHSGLEIGLRDDDSRCLELIQSYWQCGFITWSAPPRTVSRNTRAKNTYRIQATNDLHKIIIPHFEMFPLFAKKSRDFDIWRKGVELMFQVRQRPMLSHGRPRGRMMKWTNDDNVAFIALADALKSQRQYQAPIISLPVSTRKIPPPTLFDFS